MHRRLRQLDHIIAWSTLNLVSIYGVITPIPNTPNPLSKIFAKNRTTGIF